MNLAELQALLSALLGMRFGGVRSITYDGRQISDGSDAELATAIFDLERRIAASGPEMNARARWLVRNNGYAANAIESWAANTVGDGINPNSSIAQASRKDAVQRLRLDR